ncbi:MAG TPA: FecR domain-containing protein, partial [Verrucomicrobiae bacterium]
MKKLCALVILAALVLQSAQGAVDLKQSRLTQVVNNVEIISSSTHHAAEVNDVFSMPDVMRTGSGARAEMIADDGTITRVGANTIFSFDPAQRTINLDQGSLLFHAPHGKGGGTIRTGSATASVIGTTIIVAATANGGFKVLDLEGEAEVRFLNGLSQKLTPGQMMFILPGGGSSQVIVFRLDVETQGLLVSGFNNPLPSWPQIQAEITRQLTLLIDDRIIDSDLVIGDNATPQTVQVVMNIDGRRPFGNTSIIGSDRTANQPLPVDYTPLSPKGVKNGPFTPPGNFSEGLNFVGVTSPSSGFVGKNIDIDTHYINLAAFSGDTDFDIMAQNNIRIWQSVDFITSEPTAVEVDNLETVGLFAGGQMEIAAGATIEADTGTLGLVAGGFSTLNTTDGSVSEPGVLDGVGVENYGGDADVLSQSDLTWGDEGYIYAEGNVNISSDGSLTLGYGDTVSGDESFYDFYATANFGSVNLTAVDDLNLNNAEVDAGEDVNITSGGTIGDLTYGGDINIQDGSDITAGDSERALEIAPGPGGNVYITAVNGNVNIYDSLITAYNGISLAGEDTVLEGGDVYIYAAGSGDIEYTSISAYDNVNIESGDSLTVIGDGSESIDADGTIGLISDDSNVYVEDVLDASGDVNITSGQSVAIDGDETENGINIEDSTIYAGDSDFGGNLNVNAYNGAVIIDYSDIYGFAAGNSGEGSMYINSYDGEVSMYQDHLRAAGDVSITSSGTDNSDGIDIEDVCIQAGNDDSIGGNITLTGNVDEVYLWGDTFTASSQDNTSEGNITINANDGNVYMAYSGIYADQNVNIMSCGTDYSSGIDIESGTTIEAGYENSAGGNVYIDAYNGNLTINGDDDVDTIDAYSGFNADGDVSIYASGSGDIENTYIDAGGDVSVESAGSLNVGFDESEEIRAGGSISLISDNSNVYVDYELVAGGDVNITSGQSVEVGGDETENGIDIQDSEIYAGDEGSFGGNLNINAYNGAVIIGDSDEIYAYANGDSGEGSIYIKSYDGEVYMYEDSLSAAGDVSVTSSGTDNYDGIDIENADIEGGYDDSIGGNVTLTADVDEVYLWGDTLTAVSHDNTSEGNITINANDGDVYMASTGIYADQDVNIMSCGTDYSTGIDIESGSDIEAGYSGSTGGNVYIDAYNGNLTINGDDDVDTIKAYSGEDNEGDVDMYASGTGDIEEAYIDAGNTVDIETSDTLTVQNSGTEQTIEGQYGVTLESDNGDVNVNNYDVQGDVGYADIYANNNVCITDDAEIYAGADDSVDAYSIDITAYNGNVNITGSSLVDATGDVCISAGSDSSSSNPEVYVDNSDIYAGDGDSTAGSVYINASGDVSIEDGSDVYAANDVDINGGEYFNTSGDDTENPITVDIEDSDIEAGNGSDTVGGNVNITAYGGNVYLSDDTIGAAEADSVGGEVNITANSNIDVLSSTLTAPAGVSLTANNGYVNIYDSYESGSLTMNDWSVSAGTEVDISADDMVCINGSSIYANGGDVNINSGGELTPDAVSLDRIVDDNIGIGDTYIQALDSVNITAYDGAVSITGGSSLYAENGDVNVTGNDNVSIQNSDITANDGNVNVTSDNGMLNINAGHNYVAPPALIGPSPDIQAVNGYVDLAGDCVSIQDTVIAAGTGVSVNGNSGGVNITDANITTEINDIDIYAYDSYLYAGNGNLTLTSGSVDYGVYLEAAGNVSLGGDSTVTIEDSGIYADVGNITINSGQDLNIEDDGSDNGNWIEAESDATGAAGSITMTAGGSAYIYDSEILADNGDVSITANDELTIEGGDNYWQIQGNNVYLTANTGGVNIEDDETINANGNLVINAGGSGGYGYGARHSSATVGSSVINPADTTINGAGSTIESPSSIDLSDSGSISLSDITYIADSGDLDVTAGSDITIYDTTLTADVGSINISSVGSLTIGTQDNGYNYITANVSGNVTIGSGSDMNISSTIISADEDVSITSGGSMAIGASSINAEGGDVDITAPAAPGSSGESYTGGVIDVEGSYIYANGDIDITSSGSLTIGVTTGDTLNANGEVNLASTYSGIEVDNEDVYSYGDGIYANALFGITLNSDNDVEAYYGSISLNAIGDVNIYDSDVYADAGNICLMSGYNAENGVDIENSDIEASGNVGISAWYNVTLGESSSDWIESGKSIYITSEYGTGNYYPSVGIYDDTLEADNGNVGISSPYGTVDLEFTEVDASSDNTVYIDSADLSATGDVHINARGGSVDIQAGYAIDINQDFFKDEIGPGSDIYIGGDVSIGDNSLITSGTGDTGAGGIYINSSSSLDISAPYIYAAGLYVEGGNIEISDSELESTAGDIDITECGNVNISAGDLGLDYVGINVKNISINDAEIIADGGSINIENTGSLSISQPDSESYSDCEPLFEIDAGEININNSLIMANSGSVTISTPGDIDLEESVISATTEIPGGDPTTATGDSITITAGGYLTVDGESGSTGFGYDIGADTSVTLQGNNGVEISDAVIETLDGSPEDSLQVSSSGGNVTITDSYLTTAGTMYLSSGGTIDISGNHNFGDDTYYDVYAGGTLTLDAAEDVSITDTGVYSGSDL